MSEEATVRDDVRRAPETVPGGAAPGQDSPLIFDRPELQARRHRLAYSTLTLLAWGVWMYLWLPLITTVAWYLGFRTFIREISVPDPRTLLLTTAVYLAVVLVLGTALVVWSRYNLIRFGRRERRRSVEQVNDGAIRRWFGVPPDQVRRLRTERSLVVHHDDNGGIEAVDLWGARGAAAPEPTSPPMDDEPGLPAP